MAETARELDLITIGRAIVDVYGDQVGCRLEDVSTFSKYVGGCPANIAIGTSRLGLRVGMITRVGDEQHGRFLREQLAREGVDVRCVRTDPRRLTGIAFLAIRDKQSFPLLHYRDDCADMAISPEDYSADDIGRAGALLFSGSHLTTELATQNVAHAVRCARARATRLIFDIDYRPLFWGLAGRDGGESRYIVSDAATRASQLFLAECDLVVGTEEEIRIAGGATDTVAALGAIRAGTNATIVMKRGPEGCVVFPDTIPDRIDDGLVVPGFPVDVFNVVGAGDGFLSGFLYGWLRGRPLEDCGRFGNACGALVVSRHGCSPASPTKAELDWFLEQASVRPDLHRSEELERIHRATTRRPRPPRLAVVALDRDSEERRATAVVHALTSLNAPIELGVQLAGDDEDALFAAGARLPWVARMLDLDGTESSTRQTPLVVRLREWPRHQILAARLMREADIGGVAESLIETEQAAVHNGLEWLLDLHAIEAPRVSAVLTELAHVGVRPDWWVLPVVPDPLAWDSIEQALVDRDTDCRGFLVRLDGSALPAMLRVSPLFRGVIVESGALALASKSDAQAFFAELREVLTGEPSAKAAQAAGGP